MNYMSFIFESVLPTIAVGVVVFMAINWMIMYLPDILKYIWSRLKFLRLTRRERDRIRFKKKMLRRKARLDQERYKANEIAKARLRQNAWE